MCSFDPAAINWPPPIVRSVCLSTLERSYGKPTNHRNIVRNRGLRVTWREDAQLPAYLLACSPGAKRPRLLAFTTTGTTSISVATMKIESAIGRVTKVE
jgi:hypothetical protein